MFYLLFTANHIIKERVSTNETLFSQKGLKDMKHTNRKTRIIAISCAMILAASCVAMSACSSNNEDDTANTSSTRSTTSTTSGLSVNDLVIPADGDVVDTETIQNEDGSVTINETLSDGTVISTTTAEDGSIVQTQTHTDGSVTRVEADAQGNQTVSQTPAPSTPQETASSSNNNGGGNNGGSTTTTPTTSSRHSRLTLLHPLLQHRLLRPLLPHRLRPLPRRSLPLIRNRLLNPPRNLIPNR